MSEDKQKETQKSTLIKSNLQRAFNEEAEKQLPPDLVALIAKLNAQDLQDKS